MHGESKPEQHGVPRTVPASQSRKRAEDEASGRGRRMPRPNSCRSTDSAGRIRRLPEKIRREAPSRVSSSRAASNNRARRRLRWRPARLPTERRAAIQRRARSPGRLDRSSCYDGRCRDEERFKKLRQRMRRIGQPEVPQRIGDQQMSEFIVDIGHGHRVAREQGQTQHDRKRGEQNHAPYGAVCEPLGIRFEPGTPDERE